MASPNPQYANARLALRLGMPLLMSQVFAPLSDDERTGLKPLSQMSRF